MKRSLVWLEAVIEVQRPHLPLWLPVLYGSGIGLYFATPAEPETWMLAALGTAILAGAATTARAAPLVRLTLLAVLMLLAGFVAATLRSRMVAAPVLPHEMTAAVEGRIVGLDRSASDRRRVLLDRVVVHGLEPELTPERIRISLDDSTPEEALRPGGRILGQARISPPAAPAEPGGFDFRRMAWFMRLGAVGYSRTPMLETEGGGGGFGVALLSLRLRLADRIVAAIPGRNGGFAAAILTGDRSDIDPGALADLRASNLAHLLAISGLHMGLLTGFVFASVRYGLAVVPPVALRLPLKKIAAVVALLAGAAYLAISGANVATQRAFIMTAVVLIAVLIDRPAFTLRSVALAAAVVLAIRPESLTEAGFQMSFAATTALIATFEWLRGRGWWREMQRPAWRFVRPAIGIAITSFVAGAATAPISAFHFNMLSQYGLLANILGVPAMGLVVMPAAVIAGLAGPLGLGQWPLMAMDAGIGYILTVASFVAGLEGAVRPIPSGPPPVLPLIAFGGLVLALWIGRGRLAGLGFIACGLAIWSWAPDRPEVLISEDGRLFGVRTAAGRVLSSERGNAFAARSWLDNDGDLADQGTAHVRAGLALARARAEMVVPDLGRIVYLGWRDPTAEADADCAGAAILVAPRWSRAPGGGCLFIGRETLAREGALAIRLEAGAPVLEGARSRNRTRPWTRPGTGEPPASTPAAVAWREP